MPLCFGWIASRIHYRDTIFMSPEKYNAASYPLCSQTSTLSSWSIDMVPGPYWSSFEQFRTGGLNALESIRIGSVATLRSKSGAFRILRDEDFQRLWGLASEVHRLQTGLKFVIKAAKVALKHPDQEHVELLIQSASMIAQAPELPQREGH